MPETILTGNPELIRDINTQSVIRTIMENGAISRSAVAARLGLTKATVSAIVQTLLDRGLVLETGSKDTQKGRKPILLEMNGSCGYIVSLDLGVERISLMTADMMGKNCRLYCRNVPERESDLIPVLTEFIQAAQEERRGGRYGLLGIALGIHGVVHHNRMVFLPYASYAGLDLAGILSETFGVPVYLDNEANLSVLGEWSFCQRTSEMLFISIHSGAGAGIIMRNQLVKGKNGYAGEFGHTIVEIGGRPCPCGNRGCLEQYVSERALFAELSRIKNQPIGAEQFENLYRQGDPDAHRLMKQFITYMSVGINNLLHTFNPDVIVLNSVLIRSRPTLCEDITGALRNNMKQYCRLIPSTLQDASALLGGICLVQNKFLAGHSQL